MGRRKYRGQEWATWDSVLVTGFMTLLVLALFDVRWLYGALVYAAVFVAYVAYRVVLRRRREKANQGAPYWVDHITGPRDT